MTRGSWWQIWKEKKNQKETKRRGIEVQFPKPVSLPAANHLLPGCLRWWAQKHFVWGARVTPALGGEQTEGKKHENEGIIGKEISQCTPLFSYPIWREQPWWGGRESQPCLPSSPCPRRPLLSSLSQLSPTRVPGEAGGEPRRLLGAFTEHNLSHIPPSSPSAPAGTAPFRSPAQGPVPWAALLPFPISSPSPSQSPPFSHPHPQQHSAPGSFMPCVSQGLAFWEDVFMHSCPANSIFCSFFLWNQWGCHHIVGRFQWHFQACPDLDQMYLLELLAFYFKHGYLFFLQIKSTH